ncbi:hypothetical protein Micbo1qcDRAFT_56386 [Microdochium bolleyi]|uniref:Transcription factor domain-containing protein n=1 Tax=Microdochium bolleyi TaxID=196109 RepID=A0A136IJX7_9PEZI|nr:hypothetical protein Micbo1qcDRAFT_56386 [Microdochium bolleyi]
MVPVTNEFAASLLSVYLENEHPIVGTFDTETFLDSLVTHQLDFCSSLLVSCVLTTACQCYTAIDRRAGPLTLAFLREATAQWRAGAVPDSATSLAAVTTLCIATMSQGHDNLSVQLLHDAWAMAERLGFCGVYHSDALAVRFRRLAPEALWAASHAAWGAYVWLSVHASYYGDEPVLFPPLLPIPGVPPSAASAFSIACTTTGGDGDGLAAVAPAWPRYPQPAYMGHTFGAWCQLWTIDQATRVVYHQLGAGIRLAETVPLAFVEQQYQRLLSWASSTLSYNGLTVQPGVSSSNDSENTNRNNNNKWYPHVLILHAYFHIIVLDLLRPFLQQPRMYTLSSPDSSRQAVFDASFRKLRALLVRYCARTDLRLYNFYLNGACLHVAHIVLHDTATATDTAAASPKAVPMPMPVRHFYMNLCMGWMQEVHVRYAVIGKAAQAHMALVLAAAAAHAGEDEKEAGGRREASATTAASLVITASQACEFLDEMQRRGRHHELAGVALSCVVDFDSAPASRDAGRAQELARRFDELVLFSELTTGIVRKGSD